MIGLSRIFLYPLGSLEKELKQKLEINGNNRTFATEQLNTILLYEVIISPP